jgi:hypothetical protein
LDDSEVDLDLIEPARMDRRVHQSEPALLGLQPCLRPAAPMRGAIVHDPEHPRGRASDRFLAHDLSHQAAERRDAPRALTPPEDLGRVHISGRAVGQGTTSGVLMLDPHRTPRHGRLRRVPTHARLNARLLVHAEAWRPRSRPCQRPASRSRMSSALAAKAGSRGESQRR